MKCVYVNSIIKQTDGTVKFVQLAEHELYSDSIKYSNYSLDDLKNLYNQIKDDKSICIDFSFDSNNAFHCEPSDVQVKSKALIPSIAIPGTVSYDNSDYDIFRLLYDIASNKGIFFQDHFFMVSKPFMPQYDLNTGECYIKTEKENVVLIDSFNLLSNSFYFAVPEQVNIQGCKFITPITHLDAKFSIYKYVENTLPLQTYNPDSYRFCAPLINKYMNLSYKLQLQTNICNMILAILSRAKFEDDLNTSSVFKYLQLDAPSITASKMLDMWEHLTFKVFPQLLNTNPKLSKKDIPTILKMLGSPPEPLASVCELICYIIIEGGFTPIDQLTYCIKLKEKCSLQLFLAETYLLRVSLIMHIQHEAGTAALLPVYITGSECIYNTKIKGGVL